MTDQGKDIARLKGTRDIPGLVSLLSNNDPEIRKTAASTLGELGAKEALTGLLALLEDSDPHVRLQAARTLGSLGDSGAVNGLIRSLSDREDYVRWNAAEALGKIGDPRAIEPLITTLNDKRRLVRVDAAKALAAFTDDRAQQAVDQYKRSKQGLVDSTPGMSQMEKNKRVEDWMVAATSGVVSGVVIGFSAGSTDGRIKFGSWIVCYVLFLSWLKGSKQFLGIVITMLVASLIVAVMVAQRS